MCVCMWHMALSIGDLQGLRYEGFAKLLKRGPYATYIHTNAHFSLFATDT